MFKRGRRKERVDVGWVGSESCWGRGGRVGMGVDVWSRWRLLKKLSQGWYG
jgi:hypothetical protein